MPSTEQAVRAHGAESDQTPRSSRSGALRKLTAADRAAMRRYVAYTIGAWATYAGAVALLVGYLGLGIGAGTGAGQGPAAGDAAAPPSAGQPVGREAPGKGTDEPAASALSASP